MASKRPRREDWSGPGMKKANVAAPFKFIAFQKSGGAESTGTTRADAGTWAHLQTR
jgi:hypothetical protein